MFGHYLLTLYRTLTRHRLYAALNVLGLAVGIAVFLALWLLVRFETSYDRWIPNADNVYRVSSVYTWPGRPADSLGTSSGAVLPAMKAEFPQIIAGARTVMFWLPVINGSVNHTMEVLNVDRDFFDVLDLPLVSGDRRTALAGPDSVVIRESVARQYFGTTNVIGKSLVLAPDGKPQVYHVSAVLKDLPANTQLTADILVLLTPAKEQDPNWGLKVWYVTRTFTYVRFHSARDAQTVAAALPQFVEQRASGPHPGLGDHASRALRLVLDPLPSLHFADAARASTPKPGVDARSVYSLGAVGVLTLLIAALNYVNLATARSAVRAKDIVVRKVHGATRRALIAQLLVEAIVFALLAVLAGSALTELTLPFVNAMDGQSLRLAYWGEGSVLPLLLFLALILGIGAGLYPALALSRLQPAPILASTRNPGGGRAESRLRSVLIGLQFVFAIAFTICTFVVAGQAYFLRTADRGFQRDGLLLVFDTGRPELDHQRGSLLDAFRQLPGVVSVTTADETVGQPAGALVLIHRPGDFGDGSVASVARVGDDFQKTYGARVVAGRMFDRSHPADDVGDVYHPGPRPWNVVLNRQAVRELGFASPRQAIDKMLYLNVAGTPAQVIGVIGDVRFGPPQKPVAAEMYFYSHNGGYVAAVRYAGVSEAEMLTRLKAVWRGMIPDVAFAGRSAETGLRDYYVPEEQRARLFTLASILAVAVGCVGLYGLASFNTARRFKEIGIRKTLGASTSDILRLLLLQILQPVLVANLIAWPLAYFAMRGWLASFDQRIALSPLYFAAATLLALVIACLTVVAQSLRLARSEPAKALRHE